ncbi:MAG: hypothetical protein H7Y42_11695 [Chitinophagaceae bacterium]|nr:hypothetical protein [Chitinophagaceae bacterium]
MNNTYVMSATLEAKKNTQASMITAGFAGLMILLMFLLKWKLPVFEKITEAPGIEVELNLPEEPPTPIAGGGGGGGNPVQASGPSGIAPHVPPAPGIDEDSRDLATDENEKESPAVVKPTNPKPTANRVIENTSIVKTTPKPVVENPAPKLRQGAQMGKTTTGSGRGGGAAENYDRTGGAGNGSGVGTGNGTGGGTGGGNGGGNGTGSGTGNGPKRISGSRFVSNPKPMNAGENIAGKVLAEIKVSADGIGTFLRGKGGSLMNDPQAIAIIKDWLRRNRFNASSDESTVVYEFNIKLGG